MTYDSARKNMASGKKRVLLFLLDFLGINFLFRFINRHRAIVLWYHGVSKDDFDLLKGYDERHIPKRLFREQVAYLRRKGYSFVTLSEFMEIVKSGKRADKTVTITFDDGFKNVVENAYPIMEEFQAKGCFYLVSSLMDTRWLLWTDHVEAVIRNHLPTEFNFTFQGKETRYPSASREEKEFAMRDIKAKLRTLSDKDRRAHLVQFANKDIRNVSDEFLMSSWQQIRSLNRDILEIGSHTRNHPDCATLTTDEEFDEELRNSKKEIEGHIGYEVKHFCFPAGSFDERVIEKVKESGYQSAATIIPGFNDEKTDRYRLRRIAVEEDFELFKARVSGSYFFISGLLTFFRGGK